MEANSKVQTSMGSDVVRALVIVVAGCVIGLSINAFKEKPFPILAADGPGAIPDEPRISLESFRELLAGKTPPLILDARNAGNFNRGHAPGAINVSEQDFVTIYNERNLGSVINAAPITVVMCDSSECPAADRVAKILNGFDHKNVRVLRDGWRAYEKSGLPIEIPEPGKR